MNNEVQRRFILGDQWAYFKIYSGPKTLETILTRELHQVVTELFQTKIIDKFFFIRYTDPDYHLRIRFHLRDVSKLNVVIRLLNNSLKYYLDNRLVWNVSADTYSRELERYGKLTITEMESLFCLDSLAIVNFLKETEEAGNDLIKWLWGVKCMDVLLEQFGLSLSDKIKFYKMLNDGYSSEFQINKSMRIQLDKKYRKEIKHITNIIDLENGKNFPGLGHISGYMSSAQPIIQDIVKISDQGKIEMPLNNLLSSLVHMHFNRLFRTKQRMHELVVYYFMCKFYSSQAARLQYGVENKVNK
ncbi:thiopeptide-type bacteriocin biosynthesis protein [Sunxiuqinia dokdonensis]|uniref:Thiopeptide-type bacteriocin biosynthesis domain-containing protein n=1 Tax=Sunxiuqinia dokdonensis TaxID=1409788 RepID=A0A0L8V4G6_9BACT|nr:thiopeptide-type bacteriocin biosynthesis protein [Sunxiuqinia dokdonensis]KOH43326.1 hypothetical protein NC99_38860 [Sunxiuqinia dokdonensis]